MKDYDPLWFLPPLYKITIIVLLIDPSSALFMATMPHFRSLPWICPVRVIPVK